MALALIKLPSTVCAVTDYNAFQGGSYDALSLSVAGAFGLRWSNDTYAVLPANYTDTPPEGQVQQPFDADTLSLWTISDGVASGPRKWTAPASPDVPDTITNAQCRQQLVAMGLFSQVDAAIQAIGGNTLIKWEYANIIERSDTVIAAIASQYGKSSADIDSFFIAAQTY